MAALQCPLFHITKKEASPEEQNWASLIKPERNSFRVGQKNKAGPEEPEPA